MSDTENGAPESATEVNAGQAPGQTFSLEYVQELRGEAAKYRNEKKTAVEAARDEIQREWQSKLTEQVGRASELEGQLGAAGLELTKLKVALALNVPSDKVIAFADILKGTTEDEIKSSAESAKSLFGGFGSAKAPATDPTQGSGGGAVPLNGDPLLAALKKAVGA